MLLDPGRRELSCVFIEMKRRWLRDTVLVLLGFTYLVAFASVFLQAPGLYGVRVHARVRARACANCPSAICSCSRAPVCPAAHKASSGCPYSSSPLSVCMHRPTASSRSRRWLGV
jgi:hypothetical protein